MDQQQLLRLVNELTGSILPMNNQPGGDIELLQRSVIESLVNQPEEPGSVLLKFENLEEFSTESLSESTRSRLEKLVSQAADSVKKISEDHPFYKVYRREVPILSSQVSGSVPAWGRGALIEKTLGPFILASGRRVWFDFFRVTKLIPVYIGNEATPSLFIPLRPTIRIIHKNYTIQPGTAWIRSNRICPGLAASLYTGFIIKGGELEFTQDAPIVSDQIKTAATNKVSLHLDLVQAAISDESPDQHGADAKNAKLSLPEFLKLSINGSNSSITAAGNSSAELYGTVFQFSFDNAAPQFNSQLNRILVPYTCTPNKFTVRSCHSPFATLSGEANLSTASWALQTASIDLAAPPAAAGTGAMAILVKKGLKLSWRGLKNLSLHQQGFVTLPSPFLLIEPGRICISDTKSAGTNAAQQFKLWNHESSGQRSIANLNYNPAFPLQYNCYQNGTESITAVTNLNADTDRPLKVDGYPFRIQSKNSFFLLASSQAIQLVYLLDNDLLQDNANTKTASITFHSEALALENALMTVSPATAVGIFGELADDIHFDKAILLAGFGMLGYLPTLPDPYAANVGIFRKRSQRYDNKGKPIYTTADFNTQLIGIIGWPTTPGNIEVQHPVVSFHFAPVPAPTPATVSNIPGSVSPGGLTDLRKLKEPLAVQPANLKAISIEHDRTLARKLSTLASKLNTQETQAAAVRDRYFPQTPDSFALLDVSTNADWMGVSFGIHNDDFIFRKTHTPVPKVPEGSPLQIKGMNVIAPGKFVRAFTTPLISWEPVLNLTAPPPGNPNNDPNIGLLMFPNDGGPSRIFNTSVEMVPIAPIPVADFIIKNAQQHPELPAWSVFTLPFGLRALAVFNKESAFYDPGNNRGAKLSFNNPEFPDDLKGGIQLKITSAEHPRRSSSFEGMSFQESNLIDNGGNPTGQSMLGFSVTTVFNSEFTQGDPITPNGVPLERIDFSGYGASIFSNWLNQDAAFAKTSQARFDVFRGRTAHEVIQIRSIIYPWGIIVVRTITIYRTASGFVYRHDSGWQAESDGLYDFSNNAHPEGDFSQVVRVESPYTFHPGIVRGVYDARNIIENSLPHFETSMFINGGEKYVDPEKGEIKTAPASGKTFEVLLVPVYFDADAGIDFVKEGATNGRVPSKKMVGYVQLKPQGQPITPAAFRELLEFSNGSLGGPADCLIDIADSGQKMRISRVDVNASQNAGGEPVFASAVKGTVVLPKDGSWSIVQHTKATDEVTPVSNNNPVPLLKEGVLQFDAQRKQVFPPYNNGRFKIANPVDLVKNGNDALTSYGFLQNTDTQKVLFKNPEFQHAIKKLLLNTQSVPKIADAYRLLNSPGIFPKLKDVHDLNLAAANFDMNIIDQGYKLLNNINPAEKFEQLIPDNLTWKIIDEEKIKIYIEYAAKDKDEAVKAPGSFKFDVDSEAAKWANKMNDVTMVVDLLSFKRILLIRGKFDTEKGKAPAFLKPELEFGKDLQPIVEILQLLQMISLEPDYAEIMKKGLKIVMSNSPENWEYKFQADKEIPVVKFPPAYLDGPTTPLRLEAFLKVGCYFNMALPMPPGSGITTPSAGAFIDFGAKLSVMCVSVAAATIYAVGAANVRISADTKKGPILDMTFSFAAELRVGLPVIGNVSITFGAGVIIHLSNDEVIVGAMIFFKGRAEILGGIVTVTIYIEASGKVQRIGNETNCIAQVTFALDISICFIIDISFEEKWQETKQIA